MHSYRKIKFIIPLDFQSFQPTSKRQLTPDNSIVKRHVGPARSISAQFSPATLSPSVATPSRKYSTRNNSGAVVASFGDVEKAQWKADSDYTPEVSG